MIKLGLLQMWIYKLNSSIFKIYNNIIVEGPFQNHFHLAYNLKWCTVIYFN